MTADHYSLLAALIFALVAALQIVQAVARLRGSPSARHQSRYGRVGLPVESRSSSLGLDLQRLKADPALS